MMREELGILEESFDNPVTVGFLMAGAYVVGGIAPLLPYLVMEDVLMALKVAWPSRLLRSSSSAWARRC